MNNNDTTGRNWKNPYFIASEDAEWNKDSQVTRDRIQTYNLLIRSQMLYSVELASQSVNEFEYSSDS